MGGAREEGWAELQKRSRGCKWAAFYGLTMPPFPQAEAVPQPSITDHHLSGHLEQQ